VKKPAVVAVQPQNKERGKMYPNLAFLFSVHLYALLPDQSNSLAIFPGTT
jgi:hypothetical protein